MKQIRAVLVDDNDLVRRGLRASFEDEEDIVVVGEATNSDDALEAISTLSPDVAVLDIDVSDGRGIEVCRQVTLENAHTRFLILTARADRQSFMESVKAGAVGYLLKRNPIDTIVKAVRDVAAGLSLVDPKLVEVVLEVIRGGDSSVGLLSRLSPQQRRILELIVEGLHDREIAERLELKEKTVRNYVSSLLSALGVDSRTQAAVLAIRLKDESPE